VTDTFVLFLYDVKTTVYLFIFQSKWSQKQMAPFASKQAITTGGKESEVAIFCLQH